MLFNLRSLIPANLFVVDRDHLFSSLDPVEVQRCKKELAKNSKAFISEEQPTRLKLAQFGYKSSDRFFAQQLLIRGKANFRVISVLFDEARVPSLVDNPDIPPSPPAERKRAATETHLTEEEGVVQPTPKKAKKD